MKKKYILIILSAFVTFYLILYSNLESATSKSLHIHQSGRAEECQCLSVEEKHLHPLSDKKILSARLDDETCAFYSQVQHQKNAEIQMFDVYQKIRISYPQYIYTHTGWTQQWDITYSASQWRDQELQVFVLPFSHNDPGWLYSYDTYYTSFTKKILDEAVVQLTRDGELRFTWAETVFLSRWYKEAEQNKKDMLKKLVNESRFDIVTGGWVMSDEAVSHYYGIVDQLIEGHQWLHRTLGYEPKNGWALDPFGHSSTMAYLLKRAGIQNTLIQRVHYAIKKHLGYNKQLEFNWRQIWDPGSSTDIFCHTTPFLLYNIVYSCGPDIQKCCKNDFTSSKCWQWGKYVKATEINEENVKERAEELLDAFRKKAQLYKTNVLLVPHGDDFRYTSENEWDQQTGNLKKIFFYMNNQPHMRVKVKFGTLSDYFKAVAHSWPVPEFPTLNGDFHTYNDRDDQYWSGYFTSRPFLKSKIRTLQSRLRATEILYTLAAAKLNKQGGTDLLEVLWKAMVEARHVNGLVQHHDAVTGTARKDVVTNYLEQINQALKELNDVLTKSSSVLMSDEPFEEQQMTVLEQVTLQESQYVASSLHTETDRFIAVYNPVPMYHVTVIRLIVTSPLIMILDHQKKYVLCQINPVWKNSTVLDEDMYEVVFMASLVPLGTVRYHLKPVNADNPNRCQPAHVTVINSHVTASHKYFDITTVEKSENLIDVENENLKLFACPCEGLPQGLVRKDDGILHKVDIKMVQYGTGSWSNPWRDKSGAYIFMPDGPAREMRNANKPVIQVLKGAVISSITSYLVNITQTFSLWNITGFMGAVVHVDCLVDIRDSYNHELAMRIHTDIDSHSDFYVDANGFQMMKRRTQSRLPIQGNFYPMTSMVYIEDDLFRVTLHSAQSHGVASLHPGEIEVVLDRRLMQDDWRGLNEGLTDNQPVHLQFIISWETRSYHRKSKATVPFGLPSIMSHTISHFLNNPPVIFHILKPNNIPPFPFEPANDPFPCDLHLLSLRLMQTSQIKDGGSKVLLVIHRQGVDCSFIKDYSGCQTSHGKVKWTDLFAQHRVKELQETTLTGTKTETIPHHSYVNIPSMEIKTYKIIIV